MDYAALALDLMRVMLGNKPPFDEPRRISHGEIGILACLLDKTKAKGQSGISSGELSRILGVSTGRMAIALKSLERKGYITRCTDPADKRRVVVAITEAGTEHVSQMYRHVLNRLASTLERLGEQDAKEFVRIVKRIIETSCT